MKRDTENVIKKKKKNSAENHSPSPREYASTPLFASMCVQIGLPQCLSGKASTCNAEAAGDAGSIPELGRSPGGGHGNPLQYSCLENPMHKGSWLLSATVYRVAKSQRRLKRLGMHEYVPDNGSDSKACHAHPKDVHILCL